MTADTSSDEPLVVEATGVDISEPTLSLTVSEQRQLTATVQPKNATVQTIVWDSDDDEVATVVDGLVSATGEGMCNITAQCGNATATCVVTVTA